MIICWRLRFVVALFSLFHLAAVANVSAQSASGPNPSQFRCLSPTVNTDDVVASGNGSTNKTVKDKLVELKARCRRGKLVDGKRREIRFFKYECWGNPPADYLEIQQQQRQELARLKKKYTVIEIACASNTLLLH